MPSLTIRDVPEQVVDRLKCSALRHHRSMEQELRELLQTTYADRSSVLADVRASWQSLPETSPEEIQAWRATGRK